MHSTACNRNDIISYNWCNYTTACATGNIPDNCIINQFKCMKVDCLRLKHSLFKVTFIKKSTSHLSSNVYCSPGPVAMPLSRFDISMANNTLPATSTSSITSWKQISKLVAINYFLSLLAKANHKQMASYRPHRSKALELALICMSPQAQSSYKLQLGYYQTCIQQLSRLISYSKTKPASQPTSHYCNHIFSITLHRRPFIL